MNSDLPVPPPPVNKILVPCKIKESAFFCNVFNSKFLKDLSDNMYRDAKSTIGFILGRKNLRLSFAKQMTGNNNTTMYLTFGTPLQYW